MGAAIGPFLGHKLNAEQRRQMRRERRQEQLRSMLEGRIADGRRYKAAVFDVGARIQTFGWSADQALQEFLSRDVVGSSSERRPWQPYRIHDEALRTKAQALNDGLDKIFTHVATVVLATDHDQWHDIALDMVVDVEAIAREIELRLDELDW